ADADEAVERKAPLVELRGGDPDLVVVGGACADVAAGRRQMSHGEEVVRDLDDLLPRVRVASHASCDSFLAQWPPRRSRPGSRSTGDAPCTTERALRTARR